MSFRPVRSLIPSFLLFFFLTTSAFPQNTRLPYRPLRAEWSSALNRIVMLSTGPNQLHLFDPATQTTQSVALSSVPLAFSLSPNGLFAAVGHAGFASYVDLTARSVVRTYPYAVTTITGTAPDIVLAADWLYVLPTNSIGALSIRLSTGVNTTLSNQNFSPFRGRLHPSGIAIHASGDFFSNLFRYPISAAGALSTPIVSTTQNSSSCGGLWYPPDGSRIYNACGTALRYDTEPQQDMRYLGRYFPSQVRSFSASTDGRLAVIPSQSSTPGTFNTGETNLDNKVVLLSANGFSEIGRLSIPTFLAGTRTFLGQGRWAFFDTDASAIHVVYQAETASGLLNDFAVQTYQLANPAPCTATFSPQTLTVPSDGTLQSVNIQAANDCVYSAVSNADWVQPLVGRSGSGNGALTLHVRANPTAQTRIATITLGTQTIQISQDAAPTTAPTQRILSYHIRDAAYSKALDRIVLITSTLHELHILDPVTGTDQFLTLPQPPLSLGIAPNGLKAAVGHSAGISIVNLQSRTVEKMLPSTIAASAVLLTGDAWVYAFSESGTAQIIQIANNNVRSFQANATIARLNASSTFAYISPSGGLGRLDVRDPSLPPAAQTSLPGVESCGDFWLSEDGRRFYTACGRVFRSSESIAEDGTPNGSLSGALPFSFTTAVGGVAHSSARQQFVVIGYIANSNNSLPSPDLQLYGDDGLPLLGRLRLQPRTFNTSQLSTRGRWVFWNQAGTRIFAITQINTGPYSNPVTVPLPQNEFSLETVNTDALLACTVTVTPASINASAATGEYSLNVHTAPGCIWTTTVELNSSWIRPSTTSGSGPGTLSFSVDVNFTNAPRTGTIIVGGSAVTVTQPLPPPVVVYPLSLDVQVAGNVVSFQVARSSFPQPWTAVSNVPWIAILAGFSGTGTGMVLANIAANTGATRTGTLTIGGQTVTLTQAGNGLPNGMRFIPITPCRVADTRGATGETGSFGTPVMEPATQRDFPIPNGRCFLPNTATAYSLNATVVPRGPLSYLTLWPTGQPRPTASTLNSYDGRIKANAAIVRAGTNGSISAYVTDRTDVILDINGYFVPAATNPTAVPFYPVSPCRIADTRTSTMISAGQSRTFNIGGACGGNIPLNATAFSLNITAIPRSGGLSYLTAWPTGAPQPAVSTLNAPTGTVVANAAIVPGGANGSITVFATDNTDIVIDANGFFGGTSSITPLNFHPLTPCRVSDTRNPNGNFGGPIILGTAVRTISIPTSPCTVPTQAAAYSLNATAVPTAMLQYLTVWPTGVPQPTVSTLNAFDAAITSNALIAPAGANGAINAFMSEVSHLILDINGFFAP